MQDNTSSLTQKEHSSELDVAQIDPNLPDKSYSHLWGRENQIRSVMGVLRDPNGPRLTAITGLGGIGKTALAREIVARCQQEQLYGQISWQTAKEEIFEGGIITRSADLPVSMASLLSNLFADFGIQDDKSEGTRIAELRRILASRPSLIVIDNLETVPDFKHAITALSQIAGPISRIILTSRPQLMQYDSIYSLPLDGLLETDAISLIRDEAAHKGLGSIDRASDKDLRDIYQATGGAPLAIRLVVGQMRHLPLEVILANLVRPNTQTESMYSFIYRATWKTLSPDARKVLLIMPTFPSTANRSAIQAVSTVPESRIDVALSELVAMSVLDTNDQIAVTKKRYGIHPLTRHFLNTELVHKWA